MTQLALPVPTDRVRVVCCGCHVAERLRPVGWLLVRTVRACAAKVAGKSCAAVRGAT